jgi:hypothetical protein
MILQWHCKVDSKNRGDEVDKKREITNIWLDKDIKEMLRESSFLSKKSMADIVNDLIREPLVNHLEALKAN